MPRRALARARDPGGWAGPCGAAPGVSVRLELGAHARAGARSGLRDRLHDARGARWSPRRSTRTAAGAGARHRRDARVRAPCAVGEADRNAPCERAKNHRPTGCGDAAAPVGVRMPRVSVVIPTFRRREALLRLLDALGRQSLPATEFEVIVVVDGSDDGSREAAEALSTPYALRVLWQENRGRSAARNVGLGVARGELVVMLDDDMVPAPHLLTEHARAHESGDAVAVMGAVPVLLTETTPAPAAYVGAKFNRHMERLAHTGAPVTLRDFYGGNLSVR